jgi:hypothetical protein
MMFVILLAILKTKVADPAVENVNTYVIQMDWTNESKADVDMWVLNPANDFVSFIRKEGPGMYLQRDDVGFANDVIIKADGTAESLMLNQEIVNIRQWIPGRYYVNAHVYNNSELDPLKISVKLIRVTPFEEYISDSIILTAKGSEHTMITFDINPDGSLHLFPAVQYSFVTAKKRAAGTHQTNPNGTGQDLHPDNEGQ